MDEAGKPLDGVVISALGGTTAFAVTDKTGQFTLRQLPPGPYLLRAHLQGFLTARSTMVDVRPAVRSASSFTLRKEGTASAPRVTDAAVGTTAIGAPAATTAKAGDRDESDFAWRLRHLKRGVLKEAEPMAGIPQDKDWFLTDSFEFLGRAVGSSAKAATALFSDLSLGGQVNLLTTGAFDNPLQLLQLDRTSSVAFFSVGAPVGSHGDWAVRAAMNQSDLSSWMLAGSYVVTAPVAHQYQFGMSYSLQRYEGGNTAAMMAVSDNARNVGSVFAYDEWTVSRYLSRRLRRQLRALRLHARRRVAVQPARRPDVVADGEDAHSRLGRAPVERAGRGRIPAAELRRVPAAAAHVLAAHARGPSRARHAALRGRRRARDERRHHRRARVRSSTSTTRP